MPSSMFFPGCSIRSTCPAVFADPAQPAAGLLRPWPDSVKANSEVLMDQDVPHAGHILPRNVRGLGAGGAGKVFGGFAEDSQLADDPILHQPGGFEPIVIQLSWCTPESGRWLRACGADRPGRPFSLVDNLQFRLDPIDQMGADGIIGQQVHLDAEGLGKFPLDPHQSEQAFGASKIHQDIEITVRTRLASDMGAKDADLRRIVFFQVGNESGFQGLMIDASLLDLILPLNYTKQLEFQRILYPGQGAFRSSDRYWIASARWTCAIWSLPTRSAMVRATLRMRE